jgi:hypothetical protein
MTGFLLVTLDLDPIPSLARVTASEGVDEDRVQIDGTIRDPVRKHGITSEDLHKQMRLTFSL